jgi:hypothetical protein
MIFFAMVESVPRQRLVADAGGNIFHRQKLLAHFGRPLSLGSAPFPPLPQAVAAGTFDKL